MDMGNYSEQNKTDTKQIYEGSSRDKQLFSGHRTENQELAYLRKVTITPSLPLFWQKKHKMTIRFSRNILTEYSNCILSVRLIVERR